MAEYFRSRRWRQISEAARRRAKDKCEGCRKAGVGRVQVLSYDEATLKGDKPAMLKALCWRCLKDDRKGVHAKPSGTAKGVCMACWGDCDVGSLCKKCTKDNEATWLRWNAAHPGLAVPAHPGVPDVVRRVDAT